MLSLSEITPLYPENLKGFHRFILREYLQHKILEIIFNGPHADKLCFIGGTCLRIVHNQQRFSEDLDFDNFDLSEKEFLAIAKHIEIELTREGYQVECKEVIRGAFHCYVRFPKLLFNEGLSGYEEEKILIQLDTESQGYSFTPQRYILNKFDVFTQIFIAPESLLLAQKFYAVLNRKRNKGRDFYDIVYLLGKGIKPDYEFLTQKAGIENGDTLKSKILNVCNTIFMKEMAEDVAPFLFQPSDAKKVELFEVYLEQVEL